MEGVYEFQGKPVEGPSLGRSLNLLMKIEGTGQDADNRRARVIHLLVLNTPPGQFRRPHSPERALLGTLAEAMVMG